jgi:hypothetical protein
MAKFLQAFLITFLILFAFSMTNSNAKQVWTYDFGDVTGTFDSGESASTTFLPNTQPNGGDTRVRIGISGGQFKLVNPGNIDLGTYSQLVLTASETTSDVLFQIHSINTATSQLYLKFSVNITGGDSGVLGMLFGNGSSFGGNTGYVGNSFSGIRFSNNGEGGLVTERRTGSGWSTAGGLGTAFDKNQIYTIEIYANNTETTLSYYRDGEEFTVNSRNWALWINRELFTTFGAVGLSESDVLDGLLFYGQNSLNNVAQLEIDDIVYSNSLPDIRTIEGEAGWRMLALPYETPVEQLARQNMVQGITGGNFAGAGANIFTSHTGTESDEDWITPGDINEPLNRGHGFIWGLYDNADVLQSKPLPMDLTITGTQEAGDVTVSLSTANDGWNLLGNPFSQDLDLTGDNGIENWADGTITATVQIYDPAIEGYVLSTSNSDEVAAFQGFFLENTDANNLTFPENAAGGNDATYYKQQDERRLISFNISATDSHTDTNFIDRAFNLIFTEQSEHDWDLWDASKLAPFSQRYIGMAFVGERNGEPRLKAQESRPIDLQQTVSVPVEFYSTGVSGTAELSVQQFENIPSDWTIEIEDTQTGIRQVLTEEQPFTFDFSATQQAKERQGGVMAVPAVASAEVSDESPRFVMHISPGEDVATQLPENFTLNQNYPNPFNPTTVISYELPQVADVELQVFDMLGRQVATLVEGTVQAGSHQVTFDASNLSSGVYIYRLQTAEHILTRKLTVLK